MYVEDGGALAYEREAQEPRKREGVTTPARGGEAAIDVPLLTGRLQPRLSAARRMNGTRSLD